MSRKKKKSSGLLQKAAYLQQVEREGGIVICQVIYFVLITLVGIYLSPSKSTFLKVSLISYFGFITACIIQLKHSRILRFSAPIGIVLEIVLFLSVFTEPIKTIQISGASYGVNSVFFICYLLIIHCLHLKPRYVLFTGSMIEISLLSKLILSNHNLSRLRIDGFNSQAQEKAISELIAMKQLYLTSFIESGVLVLLLSILLSRFVGYAANFQRAANTSRQAGRDLNRFVDRRVSKYIIRAEGKLQPGMGWLRDATVMIVDIRGFTKMLPQMKPKDIMNLLTDYHKIITSTMRTYGGTVDKFMGDGVLAHFGASKPSMSHAAKSLKAAEDIRIAVNKWNKTRQQEGLHPVRICITCASGTVVFGILGRKERMEFTIIGDAVNLAAKLEGHAKRLSTNFLTTEHTYRLAVQQGYQTSGEVIVFEQQSVKGASQAFINLVGIHPKPSQSHKAIRKSS